MEKIEIKSKELRNRICAAPEVNKWDFEEVTPEDLDSVKRLFLPGMRFNGEPTDVSLFELAWVKNLEELTLDSFEINDNINSILGMLPALKVLKFTKCDFKDCTEISTLKPLGTFEIDVGEHVEGISFPSAATVVVSRTSASFDSIRWDDVKKARLVDSKIHGVSSLEEKESIEDITIVDTILLGERSEAGVEEVLEEIDVSPKTQLSIEEKDEELR